MQAIKSVSALAALESVAATRVRREWLEVREQLRSTKALALTSHDRVDAVLMDPAEYTALVTRAAAADQSLVNALTERFDARLAVLNQPDARDRLLQAFDRDGQFDGDVAAGDSF